MSKMSYQKPVLSVHGSVASLTKGKPGSDVDGMSGRSGNRSNSDNTGGGANGGVGQGNGNGNGPKKR